MTNRISLAHGREYLAIPGPSVIPDAVLQAMHRPSPNIYAGALVDLMPALTDDLRRVAGTRHNLAIYIANGHGAWEAALSNVIAPGETVLAPASGRFTHGWAEMAQGIGAQVDLLDFGTAAPWDMDRIAQALRQDSAHRIKAVLAVHVDTSSSIRNNIPALRSLLDDLGHPALLMADCIASLGCDRFEMDNWGVDVMVAACQKGLMTPAGISFVFFNEKAHAKRLAMPRVSSYWDWTPRAEPDWFYQYFGGTAPTHHLYGLRAALDLINREGLEHGLGPSRTPGPRCLGRLRGLGPEGRAAPECCRQNPAQQRRHGASPDRRARNSLARLHRKPTWADIGYRPGHGG